MSEFTDLEDYDYENDDVEIDDEEETVDAVPFTEELDAAELPEDVNTAIRYYYELHSATFSKPAENWFETEDYEVLVDDLRTGCEDDPSYFVTTFQSVIVRSHDVYSIQELITNAPLQQQRGLNPSVVSNIFVKPTTGLKSLPFLLFCPQVCILSNEEGIRLIGGNHRLAAVLKMLIDSGLSVSDILRTEVECETYRVDLEVLTELYTDGNVKPKQTDILKKAAQIEFALWSASNGSRSVTTQEVSEALSFSRGVDRNSVESIRNATFNKDRTKNTANVNDAACWLVRLSMVRDENFLPITEKNVHYFPKALPIQGGTLADGYCAKQNTIDGIIKSFVTALKSYKVQSEPNAEGKTRTKSVWSLDLADFDAFRDIIQMITQLNNGTNLLCRAIDEHMASLSPDSAYSDNIARNVSGIGKYLAELVHTSATPQYKVSFATVKEKKSKAAPKKRARRF